MKIAKYGLDGLIDLANAAPGAAVYIELMPNQSPTLLSRQK